MSWHTPFLFLLIRIQLRSAIAVHLSELAIGARRSFVCILHVCGVVGRFHFVLSFVCIRKRAQHLVALQFSEWRYYRILRIGENTMY